MVIFPVLVSCTKKNLATLLGRSRRKIKSRVTRGVGEKFAKILAQADCHNLNITLAVKEVVRKIELLLYFSKKLAKVHKQSPKRRKFAKSGHPDQERRIVCVHIMVTRFGDFFSFRAFVYFGQIFRKFYHTKNMH
jgi:hypothetical protein